MLVASNKKYIKKITRDLLNLLKHSTEQRDGVSPPSPANYHEKESYSFFNLLYCRHCKNPSISAMLEVGNLYVHIVPVLCEKSLKKQLLS